MRMITQFLMSQRRQAEEKNKLNILELLTQFRGSKILDLGCDNGEWSLELAKSVNAESIFGIEVIESAIKEAQGRGIIIKQADLNLEIPFENDCFDVVHANQVIEHLHNTDRFFEEIHRVLEPGGIAILSTENLSSWHNIGSLMLGWMPFSLTNVSSRKGAIGNPLAPHAQKERGRLASWQHQRIFTVRGLKEMSAVHGFNFCQALGAGYYPFGNWMAKLDVRHAAFITIKIQKPVGE